MKLEKGRLQQFDIVITTRGSIGKVALFNLTSTYGYNQCTNAYPAS